MKINAFQVCVCSCRKAYFLQKDAPAGDEGRVPMQKRIWGPLPHVPEEEYFKSVDEVSPGLSAVVLFPKNIPVLRCVDNGSTSDSQGGRHSQALPSAV